MDLTTYSRDKVETLLQRALSLPAQLVDPDIRIFRRGGVLAREMFMRAGMTVVGKVHKRDHLCIVLGDVSVYAPDGLQRFEGYHTLECAAGTQRTLFAHTDTWWTTLHSAPEGLTLEELEALFVTEDMEQVRLLEGTPV